MLSKIRQTISSGCIFALLGAFIGVLIVIAVYVFYTFITLTIGLLSGFPDAASAAVIVVLLCAVIGAIVGILGDIL